MKSLLVMAILIFLISPPSLYQINEINKNKKEINVNAIDIDERNIDGANFKIIYPKCSNPAIVEKGRNFTIILLANLTNFGIKISTAYEPVIDEFCLKINDIASEGNVLRINVNVPKYIPIELYNLTISSGRFSLTEPRAVSIVDKIDGNFTFVHMTDLHIGDPRGMKVSIRETIGWKAVKKCIEEINLLHPDFVVITGDLTFGQLYPFEYSFEYKKLYGILQRFDVPTFLCPGNHDGYIKSGQDGFQFWEEYFGSLYYSFDYGKAHFIMANSYDWPRKSRIGFSCVVFNWGGYIGDKQLKWIEEDLKNSNALLNILALHHNPLWNTTDSLLGNGYYNREKLLKIIYEYVDVVLAGHVHYDNVTIQNNTIFITTTTAASSLEKDAYWGYRLIEVRNWSIFSYNYKEPRYSIPSYRLNISFENKYKAIIENDLEMKIVAYLKFVVPTGNYSVKNGEIIKIRKNEEEMEIYVISKINEKTRKEVYLF